MKLISSTVIVLSFFLASGSARSQVVPDVPNSTQAKASLDAQGKAVLDEMAIRTLHGSPAVAIIGTAFIGGAQGRLTNAAVRDTVELTLRRNGIPVVPSCEGGTANCGRLVAMIRADCLRDVFPPPDQSGLCAVYVKVGYREAVSSRRPQSVPAGVFGEVWDDDGLKLTTDKFDELALKQLTETVEKFALFYLRANPAK